MDIPYASCRPCAVNPLDYENASEKDVLELQEDLAMRINALGHKTTFYISKCLEEDKVHAEMRDEDPFSILVTFIEEDKRCSIELNALFGEWERFFVDHVPTMLEVQTYELEDELEDEFDQETGELLRTRSRRVKNALGFQVFAELTRLFYLINRKKLIAEVYESEIVSLCNTRHDSWIAIYKSFDITAHYEEKEEKDAEVEERLDQMKLLWEKPVLQYTQAEYVLVVLFMSQQLNNLKQECMGEFKRIYNDLWIRASMLIHQVHSIKSGVLDEEEMCTVIGDGSTDQVVANRDFYAFNCFYMAEIMKRLHYYDMNVKNNAMNEVVNWNMPKTLSEYAVNVKEWIERMVMEDTPEEAFQDLYIEICNEAYDFAGDFPWFKYMWPLRSKSIAANLAAMRPHLYRPFFSESRCKKHLVLGNMHNNYASRLYVLHNMSGYFHAKSGSSELKWFSGIVIKADDVYGSAYELESNRAPFLVQILSSFWAYDRGKVYITDNIYETMVIWFWLLKTRYDSKLYDLNFKAFIQQALEGRKLENNQQQQQQQQQVNTSRRAVSFKI